MKKRKGALLLAIIISLALGLPVLPASAPSIIYVDADATTGANNGTSWYDAYIDLQSALAIATARDEIWVAAGIYKPGLDRSETFQLVGGVALYGGFAGTEIGREQRDWVANATVLSGDIGDVGDSDNSYHVVTSEDKNDAVLDGFIITGGNADSWSSKGYGGGIYQNKGTLTVNNCIIYGNTASLRGGGISLADGQLTLINSIVNGNTSNAEGGGIRAGGACELIIINSTIVNNTANTYGGGIRLGQNNIITNSILCCNGASEGEQIYKPSGVVTNIITYSLVQGGYDGDGNISDDPQFVDAYDDLHLQHASPAIDAGNNRAVPAGVTVDLDGNPRIVNRTVDMGAFEYLTAPQADTLDLIKQVSDLVDSGALNPGQGNSLIVKLEAAFDKMYRNHNAAINQLEAFINQVKAFMNVGTLSPEDGQALIDSAKRIIAAL